MHGNADATLEPVPTEEHNNARLDIPKLTGISSIVDSMIDNNIYSSTHVIPPSTDCNNSNGGDPQFVHFNYNITLHGYDPCKTIRKTRKIKRQNRKEYLA